MHDRRNPYGRPGTKAAKLRQAVHERLLLHQAEDELPTSNRFLLYELRQHTPEALHGHKSRGGGRSEDQNVSDASTWLRNQGIVPWEWIVDETRSLTAYMYAETVAGYVAASVDRARIDLWDDEPPPLIICESRTFGGILARTLAAEYLCPVTATNGQAGGFLHTNVAPMLEDERSSVLYIGDLDLRGADIEANTRRVLERAVDREIVWERVALTQEQVDLHDLPVRMKADAGKGQHPAVEVEALGQGAVVAIIRHALDDMLPEPLNHVQVREQEQRGQVRQVLGELT